MHSKKGLFIRDFRSIAAVLALFVALLTIMMIYMGVNIKNSKENSQVNYIEIDEDGDVVYLDSGTDSNVLVSSINNMQYMVLFIFCGLAGISVTMLFYGDKELKSGEFVASLPIKKSTIFLTKVETSIIALIILALVYIGEVLIIRGFNISWIREQAGFYNNYDMIMETQSVWYIIANVIPFLIWGVLIVMIVALFQAIISKAVWASVIAGIMFMAPVFLYEGYDLVLEKFGKNINSISIRWKSILNLPYKFNLSDNGYLKEESFDNFIGIFVFPQRFWIKCILYVAVAALLGILAVVLYKKYETSMKNRIVWFTPAEYIIEIIFSLAYCPLILSINNLDQLSGPATIVVLAVTACCIFIITRKAVRSYSK